MLKEGRDFTCIVPTELLAYDRFLGSKGLWKGGRERKINFEEKTYKTWQLARGICIRDREVKSKPVVGALISSKI